MDLPPSVLLTRRSLLRWFALSFGLISENESRTTVLSVLDALFYFLFQEEKEPSTTELHEFLLKKFGVDVSEKLLRYHLNKLIKAGVLKRKKQRYCINSSPEGERNSLRASFDYWVKLPVLKNLERIEKVVKQLEKTYKN